MVSVADRRCTAFPHPFQRSAWVPHPSPVVWWDQINNGAARPLVVSLSPPRPNTETRPPTGNTTPHTSLLHLTFSLLYQLLDTGFAYQHTSHIATHPHHHPRSHSPGWLADRLASRQTTTPALPATVQAASFSIRSFLPGHPWPGFGRTDSLERGSAIRRSHFVAALLVKSRQDGEWSTAVFSSSTHTSRAARNSSEGRNIPSTTFGNSANVTWTT
jgi:hypothetical protein